MRLLPKRWTFNRSTNRLRNVPKWISRLVHEDPVIRKISAAALIDRFGNGLLMSVLVIYFAFVENLGPAKTALALTIGGAAGLVVTIPAGHIVDRAGQRTVVVWSMALNGLAMLSFVFVHTLFWLIIAFSADAMAQVFSRNGQQTLIARLGTPENAARNRAYTRAINNLGIGLGSLGAGVALSINSAQVYRLIILLNASTFFIGAMIYRTIPYYQSTLREREKFDWSIIRDGRYIAATVMAGITNLHFLVQNIGIPIWVVKYTHAPRWWLSAIFLFNTASVVLFQVRISKRSKPLKDSAGQYLLSALLLAAAFLFYAVSDGPTARLASALLLAGMALHVIAELLISMVHWQLSFDLADPARRGAYYGLWTFGDGLIEILGPSIITFALVSIGKGGWALLAAMFVINASLYKYIVVRDV